MAFRIGKKIQVEELRDSFLRARPFPHFVIDGFLEDGFAKALFAAFPRFSEERAIAEHGRVGGKATREDLQNLGEPFRELDAYFASQEFLDWMSRATGIPELLYDPDYVGGGTHENMPGQDMSVHVDFNYHPKRGWHRRVNALLYLNPEWEDSWGGALELWRDPWAAPSKNEIAKIAPAWNRLAVFPTTEWSWHGFEAVRIPEERRKHVPSRRSVAIYLYTKERPAEETGAMHSTIYYERPLPETIKVGEVLSKADYDELLRLTVRRDELLKFLYHREQQFSKVAEETHKRLYLQQDWINRQREFRDMLACRGKLESTPVVVRITPKKEYVACAGIWAAPDLGYSAAFTVDLHRRPRPGDWVLMEIPHTSVFQLVQIAEAHGELYLGAQPAAPKVLLVMGGAIHGVVTEVRNEQGERVELPGPAPVPLHGKALIRAFLLFHTIKNAVLGRIKSPWLWRLSASYRRFLARLGIHVPVILPPKH